MLSLLLFRQIAQMFLALLMGYAVVRCGLLNSTDSKVLSRLALYVISPCVIINSYQIQFTADRLQGMLLALGAAVVTHLIFFLLTAALKRPLGLTPVEQASLIYSNASNLTIPIVTAVLGGEYVIYVSMYVIVQLFLMWSHGRLLLSGENQFSLKKVLLNINIISIIIGAALFFLRIPLPGVVSGALQSVGGMIGPLTMIVAGMLMGGVDLLQVVKKPGIWKVTALRLLVYPLVMVAVMRLSGAARLLPDGQTILLVSLLSSVTPSAAAITQLAQIYSDESDYAGAINVLTTALSLATIPIMIMLYQM
ncbi:MAG: AEC family transporter [Oscillibacter sp.]|nr:AEC family transporter [Oscillibacter sp.]